MRGRLVTAGVVVACLLGIAPAARAQQKRIYIANDDHTDYMWKGTEAEYKNAFIQMLDFYVGQANATIGNASPYQSRFNTDGTFWIWTYEKNKTQTEYDNLISRVQSGHITVPLNALVNTYGAQPTEAILRGMYYGGILERRHNMRLSIVEAMENQTLPLGLGGLWAGAGAKYTWKGVCGCASNTPGLGNRANEIYKWDNLDGSTLLVKWNSLLTGSSQEIGGYAEARNPSGIVSYLDTDSTFNARWPYLARAGFGYGWDDLSTTTTTFPSVAQSMTNANRQVIVSNETDFFQDFETNFGSGLPLVRESYGNEWDVYSASMSEVSGQVRRSVEKLRGAEALATLVSLKSPTFWTSRKTNRDQAMINLGIYWEHNWTADGNVPKADRATWQRGLATQIAGYVDTLQTDAATALGGYIPKPGSNERFFVFNPLSFTRDDMADYPLVSAGPVHVIDVATGLEVPSQFVVVDGTSRLRILATGVPSMGYKVYEIQSGAGASFSDAATVTSNLIENSFYQVTLDPRGAITSLVDKTRGNLQLAKSVGSRVINDLGGSGGSAVVVENQGPVSVTLKATSGSPLGHTSRLTFIRNSDRIDIRNDITQNFGSVLTWAFGFELGSPQVRHEELGAVLLGKLKSNGGHYANQNARLEWLTLNHFADMTGGTNVGLTLSNSDLAFMKLGNSGITTLDTTTPQIAVLAGGQVDGPGLGITNQGGDSQFLQRFALRSHGTYDEAAALRFSLEHQNPFVTGTVTGGTGYPSDSYSFASLSRSNAFLWTLKPAEEGIDQAVVARIWDTSGASALTMSLAPTVASAEKATHIETSLGAATVTGGSLSVPTNTGQPRILTFRLHPGSVAPSGKAVMQTPTPGSTLPGSTVTFTWSAGTGSTGYWLEVGTSPGAKNIWVGSQISTLSTTVTGIPTNGSTVYVRLWTLLSGAWQFNDYTYTASGTGGGSSKAVMQTPAPGSTLAGSSVTFTWSAGAGATAYWLEVGTGPGATNISAGSSITTLSTTVNGIPTNGSTIYVRLWTRLNGAWVYNDYTYTAAGSGGGSSKAVMQTPVPGSTLPGSSVTFTWSAGTGATAYWLDVGTGPGATNISAGSQITTLSTTVNGIPTNGSTVYVRLWTKLGAWQFNDYTYTASGTGGGSSKAVMQTPVPGSTLPGSSVTFTWSAGAGASAYWLEVGTTPGAKNIWVGSSITTLSTTVNGIPTGSVPIYVRLWTKLGTWVYIDYTYTAAP